MAAAAGIGRTVLRRPERGKLRRESEENRCPSAEWSGRSGGRNRAARQGGRDDVPYRAGEADRKVWRTDREAASGGGRGTRRAGPPVPPSATENTPKRSGKRGRPPVPGSGSAHDRPRGKRREAERCGWLRPAARQAGGTSPDPRSGESSS